MRSIVTVNTAATVTNLTTLERVKSELRIKSDTDNDLLTSKIGEASSAIQAYLGYTLARETVTEVFRPDSPYAWREQLILNRTPVVSITSAEEDDVAVDSDEYEVDKPIGALYRLDSSGYRSCWQFCKSAEVVYSGGWKMPGESGRTLPEGIEAACVALVRSYWFNRTRDPLVKSEEIPGVMSQSYWIGGVGQSGELPPDVISMLHPFRRPPL